MLHIADASSTVTRTEYKCTAPSRLVANIPTGDEVTRFKVLSCKSTASRAIRIRIAIYGIRDTTAIGRWRIILTHCSRWRRRRSCARSRRHRSARSGTALTRATFSRCKAPNCANICAVCRSKRGTHSVLQVAGPRPYAILASPVCKAGTGGLIQDTRAAAKVEAVIHTIRRIVRIVRADSSVLAATNLVLQVVLVSDKLAIITRTDRYARGAGGRLRR